jgi:hypothetical protein
MILAIVNNNTVTSVVTIPDDGVSYIPYAQTCQIAIDITSLNPQPQVGWIFNGGHLINNAPPVNPMLITKLAMLQRFTVPERLGILAYVDANPASIPAVLLQNILVTTYVDLNRPDTQAGINYLVNFGLLTTDRAHQILTTPPTAYETYQG